MYDLFHTMISVLLRRGHGSSYLIVGGGGCSLKKYMHYIRKKTKKHTTGNGFVLIKEAWV